MNKVRNITTVSLLFLLFVGGTILVPSVHRVHCDGHHATHKADKCAICQLAHTSIITTASVIAPIAGFIKFGDAVLPQAFIPSVPLCGAAQARAPPVA